MATRPSSKPADLDSGSDDLAKRVALAEAAVASVKDPELKRVAFEKVLERLLAGDPAPSHSRNGPPSKSSAPSSPRTPRPSKRHRGPTAYVRELINDGFFDKPKSIGDVKSELATRGHHVPITSLSGPMQSLCKERLLRRQLLPANGNTDAKKVYSYSKW